jgi:hypothetical protein
MGACLTNLFSLDIQTICESVPQIQGLPLLHPMYIKTNPTNDLSIIKHIMHTMGKDYPDFYKEGDIDYEPITVIRYTTTINRTVIH